MIKNNPSTPRDTAWPGQQLRWPASAIWRRNEPMIRKIGMADLRSAIVKGIGDFAAMPSHALFAVFIYPIVGLVIARLLFGYHLISLVYPALIGFAFIGPIAALGLYELSRRREKGLPTEPWHALDAINARSALSIAALSAVLLGLFFTWIWTAHAMYTYLLGAPPLDATEFLTEIVSTPQGRQLIIAGNALGLVFATLTLAISVVSFPMLVDRNVSAATALRTSVRAVLSNPVPMLAWGAIVALSLLAGAIPLLLGLTVVLPILGHTTWHLYRALVA